jgi:hypothetical protein
VYLPDESQGTTQFRPDVPRQDHRRVGPRYRADHTEHQDHPPRAQGGRRGPRGPRRRSLLRRKWFIVPIAALGAVLAGGVAIAANANAGVRWRVVAPVTVQALGVDVSDAAVGQTVTAGVKLVAERDATLAELAIAVRGPDGQRVDFPHVRNWSLGTSQKEFVQSRTFDQEGTYRYWFTYLRDGRWIDLNPRQTFTVGGAAVADPGASATANPTPSGSAGASASAPAGSATTGGGTGSTNNGLRGCAANPGGCGYPTTASAGVPAGKALTVVNGGMEITTDGQVVDGVEIRGCVDVNASNVTIRNSRIVGQCSYGIDTYNSNSVTIERVEINCSVGRGTGIAGPNFAAKAVHIHDCENGLEINSNSSIVDSVIAAREGASEAHGDGIQSQGGNNVTIRHNTLLETNPVTSAIITNPTKNSSWLIEDNLLGGGAYTLYCPEQGTNFVVRNNRFVQAKTGTLYSAAYGLTDACNHSGVTWTGNYRDGDGAVVNP